MDSQEYTNSITTLTLIGALREVADPRKARGKQHEWATLLTIMCAALASGQKSIHAIAQWVQEHADELLAQLQPSKQRLPSASTLYRVARAIDVGALEMQVAEYAHKLESHYQHECKESGEKESGEFAGQSIDGKEVRSQRRYGRGVCLVSLVRHERGTVLCQAAVSEKSNETKAVPLLLQTRDLTGTVTTMDALYTNRAIAQQILEGQGHYLMVVKGNQPELCTAIADLFAAPPWLPKDKAANYRCFRKTEKGHGRLETRTLESSWSLCGYACGYSDWPGAKQVLRRTCRRVKTKTGEISEQVTYGLTSLSWEQASAEQLETVWRGHWTIENRVHYVRDVSMGEDQNQMHSGNAPQVLAALRNSLITLMRFVGWRSIAQALRHYDAAVSRALHLVLTLPSRL